MMTDSPQNQSVRKRMQRLENLILEIDRFPDPEVQARTREIVRAILDLHGSGLEKILDHLSRAGEIGRDLIDVLGRDDLVGSLLLLYGLHPLDLETRVRLALDQARLPLRAQGAIIELLGIAKGVVRLRIRSESANLRPAIEEAIYEKAPDVTAIDVEEVTEMKGERNGRAKKLALPLV
jgi:hypothetical protein